MSGVTEEEEEEEEEEDEEEEEEGEGRSRGFSFMSALSMIRCKNTVHPEAPLTVATAKILPKFTSDC